MTHHATFLETGDPFPPLRAPKVGGGEIDLPSDAAGDWAAVLLYRGHW